MRGGDDRVLLWDAGTAQQRREWVVQVGYVEAVAFSPDGQTLAAAGRSPTVKLYDVAAGRERRTEAGLSHARDVYTVAYSPDGR